MNPLLLLHSPFAGLILFVTIFGIAFLYYLLWFFLPQSTGAKHYQAKRYEQAAASFQTVLKRRPPSGLEADTRRRLADTLDVLGRNDEATQEREKAEAAITRSPKDAMALQAQGDLLKRKHQYNAACTAYHEALTMMPAVDATGRALVMAKLATAHYEASRPADTVQWAEAALASRPDPSTRRSMERMSAVGYATQGDVEKAETHYREALRLSEANQIPKEIAQDLSSLASIQKKRGQFEEAIVACRKARQVFAEPSRVSYSTEAEALRDMGRFDEARAVMAQRRQAPGFDQPEVERRMQALSALGSAWIEARADQPEAALSFLEQARPAFEGQAASARTWPPAPQKGDDKLLLWCDAVKVLALAQRGDTEDARHLHEDVLRRLSYFGRDRATQLTVFAHLAKASFALNDLAEAKILFEQYRDWQPDLSSRPSAHYWLGETHLRLGETDIACDFFQQAVAPGIDSLDARRAQARLSELGM